MIFAMLVKLILAAAMIVGVLGGTVPADDQWLSSIVSTDYCETDRLQPIKASYTTLKQCITNSFIHDEVFLNEVRQAVYSNNQAGVYKAMCGRVAQMKSCIRPLIASMSPCFTASGLRATQQDVDKTIDFLCANNGAKIISFVKEGGQECLEQNRLSFAACKATKTSAIKRLIGQYGSGPAIPEQERCKLDNQENSCVLTALKTCSNPVPANIIQEAVNELEPHCNNTDQE